MTNPAQIDALVKTVTAWSQTIRNTANALGSRAHDQFQAGTLSYADYSSVTSDLVDVLQDCAEIDSNAAQFVANLGVLQITAITDATKKLTTASSNIASVQKVANVIGTVLAAAAAIGAAVASPTAAAIAAAATAVGTAASTIAAKP